jgi:hypothetical protein
MNTKKKAVVIVPMLAIGTAPAIASNHHPSKLSTNAQQQTGGNEAGRLQDS